MSTNEEFGLDKGLAVHRKFEPHNRTNPLNCLISAPKKNRIQEDEKQLDWKHWLTRIIRISESKFRSPSASAFTISNLLVDYQKRIFDLKLCFHLVNQNCFDLMATSERTARFGRSMPNWPLSGSGLFDWIGDSNSEFWLKIPTQVIPTERATEPFCWFCNGDQVIASQILFYIWKKSSNTLFPTMTRSRSIAVQKSHLRIGKSPHSRLLFQIE